MRSAAAAVDIAEQHDYAERREVLLVPRPSFRARHKAGNRRVGTARPARMIIVHIDVRASSCHL